MGEASLDNMWLATSLTTHRPSLLYNFLFPPLINWCCPETNGVFTRISPSSQFDLSSQCHTGGEMTMALDKPRSLINQRETTQPKVWNNKRRRVGGSEVAPTADEPTCNLLK